MLYKKNGAVSCVGSDFLSDLSLYMANTVAQNKQTQPDMACSKVIDVSGYLDALNAIMGRY